MKLSDYDLKEVDGKYECPICFKLCKKLGLSSHFHSQHNENYVNPGNKGVDAWNKGLTKSDPRVMKISQKTSETMKGRPGRAHSNETRKKVSESMKNAHKDGRAHNIGASRWNNEPSYPEKFFMKVIEQEFSDKNYIREYPFGRFSLDFAWIEKKICIEIDGEQHYRFEDYQERDRRKDAELIDAGWKVLRIRWKEMFDNPKYWIEVAKCFVCPGS